MVQYDKMILNRLLDTYEASLLSTGENRRKIHIEFRFYEKRRCRLISTKALRNMSGSTFSWKVWRKSS